MMFSPLLKSWIFFLSLRSEGIAQEPPPGFSAVPLTERDTPLTSRFSMYTDGLVAPSEVAHRALPSTVFSKRLIPTL